MPHIIAALIRHGHYHQPEGVPSAHLPHPLTPKGQEQAQTCVHTLQEQCQQADLSLAETVHSSALLRAWQTATILVEGLRNPTQPMTIQQDMALAERGLGSAANLTLQEIEDIVEHDPRITTPLPPGWKAQSSFRLPLPGAESLLMAGQRVADYITHHCSTLQTQRDTMMLFIGHGGAFRHAAHHMGLLSLEEIPKLSMYHCSPVFLAYQPDGSWKHWGGAWKVRAPKEAAD